MGTIVWSTNTTLDGVVEDPDGGEGLEHGGWFAPSGGDDLAEWTRLTFEEAQGADAVLVGGRTDEWFASRWTTRTGAFADRLNGMPKWVVTGAASGPSWTNATRIDGDVVRAIASLRDEVGGEILVYASYQLAMTLWEHDLVDELRVFVFPVVAGGGRRLFASAATAGSVHLCDVRRVGSGLVHLTYAIAARP